MPVLVTEHGIDTDDDPLRIWFLRGSLAGLQDAIADGMPVHGSWHWSLIDNFEWGFGYKPHFGLCAVHRTTFVHTAKPSAMAYRANSAANQVQASSADAVDRPIVAMGRQATAFGRTAGRARFTSPGPLVDRNIRLPHKAGDVPVIAD